MSDLLSPDERNAFKAIIVEVKALIEEVEGVLEGSLVEYPAYAVFLKRPEATMKYITEFQRILSRVGDIHTRLGIERRRFWDFGEILRDKYGKMETELYLKGIYKYIKSFKDLETILRERKADLSHAITSLRSIQSAITNRIRAGAGN